MALKLYAGPTSEPVTVSEAKSHCRVDITDDDTLIGTLITAARQHVENVLRRALFTQTWDLVLDEWPWASGWITVPLAPLASVTSVTYYDTAGTLYTLAAASYTVDTVSEPGRIVLNDGYTWPSTSLRPANPIYVRFVAGWSTTGAIPQAIKQAILLLIGHWYENREALATSGAIPKQLPLAVDALLAPYRVYRWV